MNTTNAMSALGWVDWTLLAVLALATHNAADAAFSTSGTSVLPLNKAGALSATFFAAISGSAPATTAEGRGTDGVAGAADAAAGSAAQPRASDAARTVACTV